MVKLIISSYKILPKKETRRLIKTLEECRQIYKGWDVLSMDAQEQTRDILNDEIDKKLDKCFDYYHRHYDVEIESGYGEMEDIEINIGNICEKVKSWEGD